MTATLAPSSTLGAIATSLPAAIPVFEELGLDYCCGGTATLAEAATRAGLDPEAVLERLRGLERRPEDRDWSQAPLPELLDHILATHHDYLKQTLPALWDMAGKVVHAHGEHHPELARIRQVCGALFQELDLHLQKEEQILFPMIRSLAGGSAEPEAGGCPSGPIGPMQVMEAEHENAGRALSELRRLSRDYELPEDACTTWRGLWAGLQELEGDLHRHIHLENNVLHPRVRALVGAG
ncbi:MAG: iron-sulfur cluster repair di-iron protein [Planctomycetota bacterium]|nr:MAG: iron-sulfur cluster repair di-iron protein [Planctomycetota bacterium]